MVLMFAPSFITGHAIKRVGIPALQVAGALLLGVGGAVAMAEASLSGFVVSQAVIGLGWNLCFVPATAGLAQQARPSERALLQSANDVAVFLTSGVCMVVAAPALSGLGWRSMQYVSFATSAVILLAVGLSEGLAAREAPSLPGRESELGRMEQQTGPARAADTSLEVPVVSVDAISCAEAGETE